MIAKHFRLKSSAVLASLLAAAFAHGEEAAVALEPVVVSATRYPTRMEDAPGQIEVLTAEQLQKRQSLRLADVVNNLPGIYVQPGRGVLQSGQSMAMRGIPGDSRSQMLLDGVPLNDGYSGGLSLGGLAPEMIDRVEVLYGPMSSLYGGSAMGGVISYTTRMPQKTEFGFRAGYGNPFASGKAPENLRKLSLSAGTRFDNGLSILAGGHWLETDGYRSEWASSTTRPTTGISGWSDLPTKTGATGYLIGNKGRTEWQDDGAYLKLEQRLADGARWRFGLQHQRYAFASVDPQTYLRNASGTPVWAYGAVTESTFLNGENRYERNLYHLGYDREWLDGVLKLTLAHADTVTNSYILPGSSATRSGGSGTFTDSPARSTFADAYWNRDLGAHGLTLGLAWRRDTADNRAYSLANWTDSGSKGALSSEAAGKTELTAAYAQDEWHIAAPLTVHAGVRYDHWESSKGQSLSGGVRQDFASRTAAAWSPKLGLAFRPAERVTLRLSAGSAFRAPTVYDLYRTTITTNRRIEADPGLKPETVRTWEIGGEWQPWTGGEVRLTWFNNDLEDLIYTKVIGPDPDKPTRTLSQRINAGRAESRGFTLALGHRFDADNRVFLNFTRTHSEIKENSASPATVGKRLTFVPEKQASAGFETRRGDWTLAASARYASKQFVDDDNSDVATGVPLVYDAYVVADAKVSYRIDRNFTASLAIDNLFDREYFSYYPAPRRSWFAELNYRY